MNAPRTTAVDISFDDKEVGTGELLVAEKEFALRGRLSSTPVVDPEDGFSVALKILSGDRCRLVAEWEMMPLQKISGEFQYARSGGQLEIVLAPADLNSAVVSIEVDPAAGAGKITYSHEGVLGAAHTIGFKKQ